MKDFVMTLRVSIVTQNEPFYIPNFFRRFFDTLSDEVFVDSVVILSPTGESLSDAARRAYTLFGPRNFLIRGASYAARSLGDLLGVGEYSVDAVCRRHGVPTVDVDSVNTESFINRTSEGGIDVLLSVSAPEIFSEELLDTPTWGCLNVHTSKLPEYRGMLPTFWAMYHGESETGVTVHTMTPEIDQGKIVRQTNFDIEQKTLDEVISEGKMIGGCEAARALDSIARDNHEFQPMEGEGSYYSFPSVDDREQFRELGNEIL